MRYIEQIKESQLEKADIKRAGRSSQIILFLIRDSIETTEKLGLEDTYEFIFSLETTTDFNPSSPILIGMYNGTFGTMDIEMNPEDFVPKSILETPLSNQLALYLVQELLISQQKERYHLENMIITLGDYLIKRKEIQSELNCKLKMGLTPFQIHKIHRYIKEHIDRPILTSELAKVVELSIHYFIRVFKRTTGETPHQFVTRLKLEEAKKLLISTDESVIQVGLGIGCENPSHFSQLFKSNFGIPPLRFRKTFHNGMIGLN